jgi:CBS domain-containing protein
VKTATIAYRVVDFLRRWPPFQYMSDPELLELAGGGRVLFHENDEIVFEQGRQRRPYVYVIQQGTVRLVEETPQGPELRDVRGEGDLLGVGRYLGISEHLYTARTETDTILYALPADLFWQLVKAHPRASRFLAAYFSVAISPSGLETQQPRSDDLRIGRRPVDWMARHVTAPQRPVICEPETPVREVAGLLDRQATGAAVVLGRDGHALGVLTPRLLSGKVASGLFPLEAAARKVMAPLPPIAVPGLEAGAYLTRMLEHESDQILLTADGTSSSQFLGLVSRRDLTRVEGAASLAIVEDIGNAWKVGELARLRTHATAMIAAALTGADAVRWLAPMATAFDAAVLRRLVALVEGALEEEGQENPCLAHCWVFFGSAGRSELLTVYDLDHGLIYEDPEPDQAKAARSWFLELGRRVSAGLAACGFVSTAKGIVSGHPSACRSVGEWAHAFSGWIRDPALNCTYRATSFFDLRAVHGDCHLVEQLERHIESEERGNKLFVPLLVDDSMANLPPMHFFRGLTGDDANGYSDELDLQRAALQPLVDLARALALDHGVYKAKGTLDRLAAVAPRVEGADTLIAEAAEAFRIALYHRARNGFATDSDGSRVDPTKLTRLEQNLLKSGFRTVLRLMEYIAARYGLSLRR